MEQGQRSFLAPLSRPLLERAEVNPIVGARLVEHRIPGMTLGLYSNGASLA